MKLLNEAKGSQEKNFPSENFSQTISSDIFRDLLNEADIKLMFKKDSRNDKESYSPVSILPTLSKNIEQCMWK